MATLTVETGSAASNSTSYVSESAFTTYNSERAVTLGLTNGTASELLILAMDYLEQQLFKGDKFSEDQALQWPRYGVNIDGYYIDVNEIPLLLQEAQMQIAIGIDGGNNPLSNIPRETRKEKVGEIEVEYSPSASNQTYLKAAHYKLKKLLKNNGAIVAYRV